MMASFPTEAMQIMSGIETKKPENNFSRRFSLLLKLPTLLPSRLRIRLREEIVRYP